MYTSESKKFKPKKLEDIEQELLTIIASKLPVRRVFLADGDAF